MDVKKYEVEVNYDREFEFRGDDCSVDMSCFFAEFCLAEDVELALLWASDRDGY